MHLRNSFFYRYRIEIFLFLAAFFIRFPFFFRDYIDKDESTFILMGQSIADGHLPYDFLWDLKPPLLFYLFALVEKVFPHSFFAIRFLGTVIVFVSAILLLKIAKEMKLRNGFIIAIAYVLLSSEFGSLQGVMSEHFAVFFLLLGIYFFIRRRSDYGVLIRGFFFGCAILCKLNYAYAVAALIIFYFLFNCKKDFRQSIIYVLLSVIGITIPVILIAMPFIFSGKTSLFINSVFLAPLEYGTASTHAWLDKLRTTWWIIALIAFVVFLSMRFSRQELKPLTYGTSAILAGTVYTFFSSGIVNGHYLIQVYPFLLILLFGIIIPTTIPLKISIAAVIVVVLSFESILEYGRLIKNIRKPEEYRSTFEVVSELKKRKLDDDRIFFADYHIAYWLLNQYPLTKSTTHPSNLGRPFLFKYFNDSNKTSLDELKFIMKDVKPKVIVSGANDLDFFQDSSSENIFFRKTLSEDFDLIYKDTTDRIFIWERDQKNK